MNLFQFTGILGILGAILYGLGDVLLLASKIRPEDYPRLKPFARLLSDSEKMVVLSPKRLIWGALLGVYSTPLVLAGFWQIYQGLRPANGSLALTAFFMFGFASIFGTFVHGTFYYMGEYIQALNRVDDSSQPIIADMISRHRTVLILTYAPLLILITLASIIFSLMASSGNTLFPAWMAAINPVTMTLAWLLLKRVLPEFIRDATEGAGFNIAYLVFFLCSTITLWNA
ncbi:MAG: holin family protein [Chloroflexi bacterium]|nr:holin family protein [Chloroflexota bacterium]